MAISLSFFPILSALLLVFPCVSEAATRTYDFNITWVRANPDGLFERPTIGINNQWPPPVMTATVGDQVIVNVDNQLGNQTTTLHFHGLFMNGTTEMDGPAQVSQCGIPAGSKFTYNFTVSFPKVASNKQLTISRLSNLEVTGITPMTKDNTQMVFEHLLSSAIQISHTNMTKSSFYQSRTGTTRRCRSWYQNSSTKQILLEPNLSLKPYCSTIHRILPSLSNQGRLTSST